jgi:hypothetical protein
LRKRDSRLTQLSSKINQTVGPLSSSVGNILCRIGLENFNT